MTKDQMARIKKDKRIAQKELFNVVHHVTVFFSKNGMPLDDIHELIHDIVDESFDQTTIALETESLK